MVCWPLPSCQRESQPGKASSYLTLEPVAGIKSGPEVPEAASGRGGPWEGRSLRRLRAVAPLAVAGAVAGGGAGAGEGGLGAALWPRWTRGCRERGEQRRRRRLAWALEGPSSSIPPPSECAELSIQRQSARPQARRGWRRGRQEGEVWGRLGPAMMVGTGAGAAVAVAVWCQTGVWGQQAQSWAAVRAQGAPGQTVGGMGAVARQARGTGTRAARAVGGVLFKQRHPGGGGAQLAAKLQLLHPPSQDVRHCAAEVIWCLNNWRKDAEKCNIILFCCVACLSKCSWYVLNNWIESNLKYGLPKTKWHFGLGNSIINWLKLKCFCAVLTAKIRIVLLAKIRMFIQLGCCILRGLRA